MDAEIRKTIGRNVRKIREASGLSQIKFAMLTGLSRASVVNIESGDKGYNINLLDRISTFSNYKVEQICSADFKVPKNLREILVNHHRADLSNYATLSETPTLVYAINYYLLESSFFESPREINEIKLFFERLGWKYLGTSIQNALKRMPDKVFIEEHKFKMRTYTYRSFLYNKYL
jgi:transcriptional regulator with XRE-family HTH domain